VPQARYAIPFLLALCLFAAFPAQAAQIAGNATVVDQAGRRIRAEPPFTRIISLYGAHTENLFALGAGERVVGVSPHDSYPPRVREKRVFSYHDGPERFLAADPDLVLIRPMIDRGYSKLISRLESAGIAIASLQPNTREEMIEYWETLGVLAGRRDEARATIRAFRRGVGYARSLAGRVEEKKTVYFEAIHKQMKTFAPESIAMFALRAAGGVNAAPDARTVRGTNIAAFGKERILARAGSIDVYIAQKGPMNQPSKTGIRKEPGFGIIKAVRQGRICIVDEHLVSRPAPRLLLGIHAIGSCLYPDLFDSGAGRKLRGIVQTIYAPERRRTHDRH
jgi:iron complex transport system substrate-binding protein